jgi:hypothetical protein
MELTSRDVACANSVQPCPRDEYERFQIPARRARTGHNRGQSQTTLCAVVLLSSCFSLFVQRPLAQGIDLSTPVHDPNGLHGADSINRLQGSHQFNDQFGEVDDSSGLGRHLTLAGKPCVALKRYATPELINKNIYEHWINASNSCGQNIKVQVCYHQTRDCIVMNVPPYGNKNAVLGIQPSMKEFHYDAKEK